MKKILLNIFVVLSMISYANAANYYTNTVATLQGGAGLSTGWFTDPSFTIPAPVTLNVTNSTNDNFFALSGATITVSGNNINIGSLDLQGGAATKLIVNVMNASNYFNVRGKFSGNFERTGSGTIFLTGGTAQNPQQIDFAETVGSSLTGSIALAGTNVILAADVVTYALLNLTGAGDLILNGKKLTAHRISSTTSGVLIGDGAASLTINTYNNASVSQSLSSTLYFDQSVLGTSNRLASLNFQKDITAINGQYYDSGSSSIKTGTYYNYLNLKSNLIVADLVFGPSAQDSQLAINDSTVPVLTIEGTFSSTSPGTTASPGVNITNGSLVFAATSTLKLRDQAQKLFNNYGMSTANLTINVGAKLELVSPAGIANNGSYQILKTSASAPLPVIVGNFTTVVVPGFAGTTVVNNLSGADVGKKELRLMIGSILPVKLTSFKTKLSGNGVNVTWTTESEVNLKNFVVERSADGVSYVLVGTKDAVGKGANSYAISDFSPLNGNLYYRLKSVDYDGSYSYSDISVVSVAIADQQALSIFPNPLVDNILTVSHSVAVSQGVIKIYDLRKGQVIGSYNTQAGNKTTLDLSGLRSGVYLLSLVRDGKTRTTKFLKK